MSGGSRLALPAAWHVQSKALGQRWQALGPRERGLLAIVSTVLGVFLLWSVAVQPAWRTLRDASAKIDALDAQLQEMQALASEVRELRATPALGAEQSVQALQAASERLGGRARLSLQGDRAVLTLNGISSSQLRDWLTEVRAGARARPTEAQLTRNAQGFSGSIVLGLGAAR